MGARLCGVEEEQDVHHGQEQKQLQQRNNRHQQQQQQQRRQQAAMPRPTIATLPPPPEQQQALLAPHLPFHFNGSLSPQLLIVIDDYCSASMLEQGSLLSSPDWSEHQKIIRVVGRACADSGTSAREFHLLQWHMPLPAEAVVHCPSFPHRKVPGGLSVPCLEQGRRLMLLVRSYFQHGVQSIDIEHMDPERVARYLSIHLFNVSGFHIQHVAVSSISSVDSAVCAYTQYWNTISWCRSLLVSPYENKVCFLTVGGDDYWPEVELGTRVVARLK